MSTDLPFDRLAAWLGRNLAGAPVLTGVSRFAGGQSNPTYRLDFVGRDPLVLRRKPFGELLPSAHAVDREYRVISALHAAGFPVPQPVALCTDQAVIGVDFYVMAMAAGRNFRDGTLPDVPIEQRRHIYLAMVDVLADLHALDPDAIGLGDFGRPGNYFSRQLDRWTRQYRAAQTDEIPEIEWLIRQLPRRLPAQRQVSLVHGDYRLDNLIFAAGEPRVVALLDWELATLGDPLADLSYLCLAWILPAERNCSLGGTDLAALGIPTLEEVLDRYCARTGMDRAIDIDWYMAFGLFRLIGILQGIKQRHLAGNASGHNAAEVILQIQPYAELAWSLVKG